MGDIRERLRAAGFSDAEITEYMRTQQSPASPSRPIVGRMAAESTATGGAPMQRGSTYANDPLQVAREIGQGLTFGWADEGEAGVRSLLPKSLGGGDYRTIRDDVRAKNRAYEEANPKTALALQVGGGLLTGGAGVKAASGAVQQAPSLLRAVARAMGTGAAAGAVGGAGGSEADDALGALKDAGVGGVVGGAVGGSAAVLAKGVPAVVRTTKALVQGQKYVPTTAQKVGRVLDAVQSSGKSLDEVASTYADDSRAILAEKIGDAGKETLGSAARLGYKAPSVIKKTLDQRASGEIPLVRKALVEATDNPVNPKAFAEQKLLEAQTASKPLYDKAVEGRKIFDQKMVDLLDRPSARRAWDKARQSALDEGRVMPSSDEVIRGVKGPRIGADVKVGRDLVDGARTDGGTLREFSGVSSESLLDELEALTTRQQRDMGQSVYNFVEADVGGSQYGVKIPTATKKGGGPSMQSKAQRRVELTNGVIDRLTKELDARGISWADEMGKRASGEATPIVDAGARTIPPRGAVSLPDESVAPSLPSVDAKHVQDWKLSLDDELIALEGKRRGTQTTRYRRLKKLRDEVDNLLYEHTEGWDEAQATYAKPMQEADAFAAGGRDAFNVGPEDVAGALKKGESYARGMSNRTLRQLNKYNEDAAAGNIRNPAPLLTGSPEADARLTIMTRGDAEKADRVRSTALGAQRRLDTRYEIFGNSKTAGRVASDAKQLEATIEGADVTSPSGMVKAVGNALQTLAKRRVTGRELDAASEFLLAGAPDQMTIEAAMKTLTEEQRKRIGRALSTQFVAGGTMGGVIGQRVPMRR